MEFIPTKDKILLNTATLIKPKSNNKTNINSPATTNFLTQPLDFLLYVLKYTPKTNSNNAFKK